MPDFDFLEELNSHISVLLGFSERRGSGIYIHGYTYRCLLFPYCLITTEILLCGFVIFHSYTVNEVETRGFAQALNESTLGSLLSL